MTTGPFRRRPSRARSPKVGPPGPGPESGPGAVAWWIVAAASRIVPGRLRDRWAREWRAELWHRERRLGSAGAGAARRTVRLVGPALGAIVHAAWLGLTRPELDSMFHDVSFALRSFRRAPVFTGAAVLTLGLGIAANVAVFAVIDGALLDPYDYDAPERIAILVNRDAERPADALPLAFPDLEEIRATGVFASVAGFDWDPFNLRLDDRTEWVGGGRVSPSLFAALGVHPIRGRGFLAGEDAPGSAPVVVLGERLWRDAFGAEDVVGRSIWLDGTPHEVVGVAPAILDVPEGADLWVPLAPAGQSATRRSHWLQAVGRLAPDVSWEEAEAALAGLGPRLAAEYPDTNEGRGFDAVPLREARTGDVRPAFLALLGAVGFLLLIVCANLTSLVLARSVARHAEFGVRQALGASRGRLARQLFTESLVLACAGGLVGLVLGRAAVAGLIALVPEQPAWFDPRVDLGVVAFTAALALVAAVTFGLAPVLAGMVRQLRVTVRTGRGGTSRVRDALVFAEVALSTVLLLAAGLLIRSLSATTSVDPGFETGRRLVGTLQLPGTRYPEDGDVIRFAERLRETVAARPDVASAAVVTRMPFRSGINTVLWWEDGQDESAFRENPEAELNSVSPEYFDTMGIALRRGRGFAPSDREGAAEVVLVNERFAREYFGSRDPVGRRISFQYPPRFVEIVGVVEDVRHEGLDQETRFQIYAPFDQRPTRRLTLVAHTRGDPGPLAGGLRGILRELDPDLALSGLQRVGDAVRASVWRLRLLTQLFWACGLFALLLAAVGITGVVAHAVARRTREIGIRIALGARRGHVLRLLGWRIGGIVAAGLAVGAGAALLLGGLARGTLYGVDPHDPLTFGLVILGFALIGALAAFLPARRAMAIDPAGALKAD